MTPQQILTREEPEFIDRACRGLRRPVGTPAEIAEIKAQCAADEALCLACEDGMVVVTLVPGATGLELFVLLAVAFRHGAFEKRSAVLNTIGRDLGASSLAFRARRRGWARRLGPEWQRRGSTEFVRSIGHVRS